MRPAVTRLLAAALVAGLACTTPTEMCGCPPSRQAVYVVGTLADAGGAPVAGARVSLDGVPAGVPWPSGPTTTTDATGAFRGAAYTLWSAERQVLRIAIVRAATTDTVRVLADTATFRIDTRPPDTVRVALRLP